MADVHFVGFTDDSYNSAVSVWGKPTFIHRIWDIRAMNDVQPNDIVIFAKTKDWDNRNNPSKFSFDDSSVM